MKTTIDIRAMVLKERNLKKKIDFNLEELEMMTDLMEVPKYKDSITLEERFEKINKETMEMIVEYKLLKERINLVNAKLAV